MRIKGKDVVIRYAPDSGYMAMKLVNRYFQVRWPEHVVEVGEEVEDEGGLQMREKFYYKNKAAFESWNEHGAVPENKNTMLHVIWTPEAITIVCDDLEADKEMLDEIKRLVLANHRVSVPTR